MAVDDAGAGWTPGHDGGAASDDAALDSWGPLRAFVRERLPPSIREARLDPGIKGALALGVVALLAAVVAVVMAWSASAHALPASHPVSEPRVSVPALPGSSPAPTGSLHSAAGVPASASPTAEVVVDVDGKVRRPGLVHLPSGARVADAINAAGGVLPGTSNVGMSLARRLVDGEQVLVGEPQPAGATGGSSAATGSGGSPSGAPAGPVDLNTATADDLDALPGIGPVLAQRVIDWRTAHGGFTSVDQLREVSGLGGKKFDSLAPLVRV